jgi:GNAT superfamily N-acetyltransferase
MDVELRHATLSDLNLVYEVTEATMRGHVEQTFGPWVESVQRKVIGDSFSPATHQIIVVGGETAGVLAVASHDTHVQLEKLFILPAFQSRGIGARLLLDVAETATAQGNRCVCACLR